MGIYDLKPVLPKAIYDIIEEDVTALHIECELSIPIDPFAVVERLHYVVRRFSEIKDLEAQTILKTTAEGSREGLSYYDPAMETYIIWINDLDSDYLPRLRFTVMHEIGHIRMGHCEDSHLAEMIANYYTAYALVPSPLPDLYKCSSFIDIADEFGVSDDCAYICSKRWTNWKLYVGQLKSYEKVLLQYHQDALNKRKEAVCNDL